MVIIAIAVGVGLFKGFEMLWANMSKIITALLAVAATGAIVGIVHALRTERDGLSMVLAGCCGSRSDLRTTGDRGVLDA